LAATATANLHERNCQVAETKKSFLVNEKEPNSTKLICMREKNFVNCWKKRQKVSSGKKVSVIKTVQCRLKCLLMFEVFNIYCFENCF
jgi:hypothetical protein